MKRALVGAVFVGISLYLHFTTLLMVYPDTRQYRSLAQALTWRGVRPPLVPLFLRLSDDNHTIALLQTLIYIASSLALAFAASRWMRREKLLAFGAALLFALVPQHFLWCRSISSESLTLSELYLLLALTTVLCRPPERKLWQIVAWVGWLSAAALFIFTRDANGYLLLFLCTAAAVAGGRRAMRQTAAALVFTAILTSICAHQATEAHRWKWPFVNILAQRVLEHPDRRDFFAERGMPVNPGVMCLAGRWGWDCQGDLSGFGPWLDGDIKGVYAQYLLHHPLETVLRPFVHLDETVMTQDGKKGMFFYFHQPSTWYWWFGKMFYEWYAVLFLLACGFAWAVWKRGALMPAWVLLASVPLMLWFVWHADAAEPIRHAAIPAALLRLGLMFGIALGRDALR
jgi:hypothetical protein